MHRMTIIDPELNQVVKTRFVIHKRKDLEKKYQDKGFQVEYTKVNEFDRTS